MSHKLIIEPHCESWKCAYETESVRVQEALGSTLKRLHHIGSTAVAGIYAKPIIDMLAEVDSLEAIDARRQDMELIGYEVMGEFGIAGRRYYRKNNQAGVRTHHIHAFAAGSPHVIRHLAFRDYLRHHPDVAQEYSDLKLRLAASCNGDLETYIAGKNDFVVKVEREAVRLAAGKP